MRGCGKRNAGRQAHADDDTDLCTELALKVVQTAVFACSSCQALIILQVRSKLKLVDRGCSSEITRFSFVKLF